MKDARFEEIREGLYQELLKANLHFKIFWTIYAAAKDIAKIRNVYLTFFVFTMRSHNDRFCIAVHNVVNPDKSTANFVKLFNYIGTSPKLVSIFDLERIEEMRVIIESHKPLTKKIARVRDQYIAHNQLTKNHLAEQTSYKYEEAKKLLLDLNSILEEISHRYDGTLHLRDEERLLNVSPSLNVTDMLRHLAEYRSERINQRKGEHS